MDDSFENACAIFSSLEMASWMYFSKVVPSGVWTGPAALQPIELRPLSKVVNCSMATFSVPLAVAARRLSTLFAEIEYLGATCEHPDMVSTKSRMVALDEIFMLIWLVGLVGLVGLVENV